MGDRYAAQQRGIKTEVSDEGKASAWSGTKLPAIPDFFANCAEETLLVHIEIERRKFVLPKQSVDGIAGGLGNVQMKDRAQISQVNLAVEQGRERDGRLPHAVRLRKG